MGWKEHKTTKYGKYKVDLWKIFGAYSSDINNWDVLRRHQFLADATESEPVTNWCGYTIACAEYIHGHRKWQLLSDDDAKEAIRKMHQDMTIWSDNTTFW